MMHETVARRYATAIFEIAKPDGTVASIGRDLAEAERTLMRDAEIRRFFVSPVVDRKEKARLVDRAFVSLDEIARNVLQLLVRKRREGLLSAIVVEYEKLALADRGRRILQITSARELAEGEVQTLLARLQARHGGAFEVVRRVDPALLGGVRIALGDLRIDASVSGRLEQLARELVSPASQGQRA